MGPVLDLELAALPVPPSTVQCRERGGLGQTYTPNLETGFFSTNILGILVFIAPDLGWDNLFTLFANVRSTRKGIGIAMFPPLASETCDIFGC